LVPTSKSDSWSDKGKGGKTGETGEEFDVKPEAAGRSTHSRRPLVFS
jgi:hypothetical protein